MTQMRSIDSLLDAAHEAAGNWQKFESFAWHRSYDDSIPDPENWCIVYTNNRDS